MPRPSLRVLAAVAATALGGVAQAGCGSDEGGLLPRSAAGDLQASLDAVETAVDAGQCDEAQSALSEVRGDLVSLPDSVDPDLRTRLQEGVDNLDARVSATCGQGDQPESDPAPTPEETAPQDTSTGEETTPPDTSTDETQPPDTSTGETQPPDTGTGTGTGEQPAPEVPGAGGSGSDGNGTGGASPGGGGR